MPSFFRFLKVESDRSPVGPQMRLLVLWSIFMAALLGALWLMPSSMAVANLILMGLNTLIFGRWVFQGESNHWNYPKKWESSPPFLPRWERGTRRYYLIPSIMVGIVWLFFLIGYLIEGTWIQENLEKLLIANSVIFVFLFGGTLLRHRVWYWKNSRKAQRLFRLEDEKRRKQKEIDELIQAAMGRKELEIYEREKEFLRCLAVIIARFYYEKKGKPSKRDAELRRELEAILEYFLGPSVAETMVSEELFRLTCEAKKATVAT